MTDKKKAKTSKPGYDSFMKKKAKGKKRLLKSLIKEMQRILNILPMYLILGI